MKLAATLGSATVATSTTLTADPTGVNPPGGIQGQAGAASNFPAGNPARFVSTGLDGSGNPIIDLKGDGSARIGQATWDSDGYLTSPIGAPGEVKIWAGQTAPSGWYLCQGQAVSRTTNAKLFAVIGTAFGSGDGSTTFNLPDMRMRLPIGMSTGAGSSNYKSVGGSDNSPDEPLSTTPGGREGRWNHSHQHTIDGQASDPSPLAGGSGTGSPVRNSYFGGHAHGGTTGSSGVGGNPTSNLGAHAFLTLNFIIRS
jgi:microcystin-dependent protein